MGENTLKSKFVRNAAMAMLGACVMTATGCNAFRGHGKYTQEQINKSRERLDQMKAATQFDMAMQTYRAGDLEKAQRLIDATLAMSPTVARAHVLRGRILIERGMIEEALISLKRGEALDPTNADASYFQAIAYERVLKREEALSYFMQSAELDPTNAQHVVAAAEMMIDLGRTQEAESYLTRQTERFEHNAGVRQTLGHLAMMRDDAKTASIMFNEARLLAPDDSAILEDLTRAQLAIGSFGEAEMNVSRLLRDPQNASRRDLLHVRARCLTELNRMVEARDVLVQLTSGLEGAADTEAWIGLGNVAYVLKDPNRVRTASARVIALAPDRPDGYMLKALWHRRMGDTDRALLEVERTLQRSPSHASALTLKGIMLADRGQYEDARIALGAALRADPANSDVAVLLGSVEQAEMASAGEL
ncbi:MAG: tetratricopeptide repeat protein [Phycisphaeraceae bacterium]|nr:tetratricopeptide repeat protein [Phycisphaeraceae bacterium]MBX3368312.1 tetratricopeptide repeat protein [Phycisphaeraceae bacterium]QYK48902.1 MAG: tetratricopeptide repeat protein [Phycisphaeraceae bacterium]